MNQQEWIEYFELVNGRKPTPAELSQAQATGEFILERPNVLSSNGQMREQRPIKPAEPVIAMTQQPQFAQTVATFQQVVPPKKGMSKKTKIILASFLGSLVAISLIVGGYSLWRYQSGKIADGTYEVVAYSYRDDDKDKMVDGINEYKDEDLDLQSFVVVKNNQSRTYNLVEGDNKSYVSLMDYEIDIPQIFDPWNKTQSQALNADQVEDITKDFMKKMRKDYSFYTKEASDKVVKKTTREYKDTLREKRTYVKHGDEYTLTTYGEKGKLESRITFKRLSKSDTDKRWNDYEDAVKDYKKELKSYSDQYDNYKDYFDYGYGYSDDYGSDSKSSSSGSSSSKKSVDRI